MAIVQIIFALVVVLALFVLGFAIYNKELLAAISKANKQRRSTAIFSGAIDLRNTNSQDYDVTNTSSTMYRDFSNAVNQRPGAEFAYNLWIFKDNNSFQPASVPDIGTHRVTTDNGIQLGDVVLFVKGSNKAYTYNNLCNTASTPSTKTDVMVKCPLLKFERALDILTVEFNTLQNPDVVQVNARNTCHDTSVSWSNMNSHKISLKGFRDVNYDKKWFMITVIVKDTSPTDPLPMRNKARCSVYINGRLELDTYVDGSFTPSGGGATTIAPSVLQLNNGDFFMAPTIKSGAAAASFDFTTLTAETLLMADLTYFNYELDASTITSMYNKGFTATATKGDLNMSKLSLQVKSAPTTSTNPNSNSPLSVI